MRRGTRVGQAYVSVTADGSGINDEIADAFDDVDYKDIGDRHGKEYGKAFQQRLKGFQDDIAKEFQGRLNKQTSRISNDLVKAFEFDSAARQSVSKSVADLFDSGRLDTLVDFVGRRAGANFGAGFDDEIRRTVLDSLENTLSEAARRGNGNGTGLFTIDQNGIRQIGPAIEKAISDVARLQQRIDTDIQKSFLETERLAEKNADIAQKFAEARLRIVEKANDAIEQSERDLLKEQQEIFDQAVRDNDAMWRVRRASADAYVKYVAQLERGQIDVFGNTIRKNAQDLDSRFKRVNARLSEFEKLTGRITGKGSRNNFLNFVGSLTQNATRLLGVLPRLGAQFADVFSTAFSSRGGGVSGVFAGLTASGSFALKGLASNAALAGGALAAITVIIGPLVAAMSLLLGTVTALASSLAFAFAGAIAAATAVFVPFVAGIGVATTAIQGLDKAQRKVLANDFKPLVEQAKSLRSALADAFVGGFDSEGVSGNLTAGLQTVQPLLEKIAVAVGDVFERFSAIGTSPAFRQFVAAMERVLPDAVRNLGDGLAGFTEGFLGVLRALAPTIESVAESISQAGEDFSKFANSPEGQRSLIQFFDDAAESLSVVKDFLGEALGLVGDLFSAGRGTGDNLFKSMTGALEDFRKSIRDGEIQRWFKDTEEFAKTLGDAIVGVGRVFDALDNEFTRSAATLVIAQLELSMGLLEKAIGGVARGVLLIGQGLVLSADIGLHAISTLATGLIDLMSNALDAVASVVDKLSGLPIIGDQFKGLAGTIRGAADSLDGLSDKFEFTDAKDRIDQLKQSLADVADGVAPQDLKKLDLLRDSITRIPDEVITEIVAEGTELSRKKIRDLIKEYNLSPGEINTLIKLLGDEPAKDSLQNLIDQADQFNRQRPSPLISVRDQATGVLNGILSKRNALQDKQFTVTAVYKTQRAPGASPGFGPVGEGSGRAVAPRTVSTVSDDAAGRMTATLQRAATEAVDVLPTVAARAVARAENNGKKAARNIEAAFKNINKRLAASIQRSAKGTGAEDARSAIQTAIERLRGYIGENGKNKKAVQALAKELREQTKVSQNTVKKLLAGRRVEDATLADFAAARARLATKIEKANDKLAEALAIRDDFATSVSEAAQNFGSILTTQGSVIDGVTQDITGTDITSNLQSRLDKIKKFQENLRILLAQGLSEDAYKQLVEAGVENGSAYVEALVNGQAGTIEQVNSLVGQIGSVADELGLETSNRLYQAGVDAAQGLVDGLESMSDRLDKAAAKLGASIARAITRALGLGDGPGGNGGGGNGGGNGGGGNGNRRASSVTVFPTPAAATYSTAQRNAPEVSGNGMRDVSLTVITPTQDPRAVAMETLNEMTGRLM